MEGQFKNKASCDNRIVSISELSALRFSWALLELGLFTNDIENFGGLQTYFFNYQEYIWIMFFSGISNFPFFYFSFLLVFLLIFKSPLFVKNILIFCHLTLFMEFFANIKVLCIFIIKFTVCCLHLCFQIPWIAYKVLAHQEVIKISFYSFLLRNLQLFNKSSNIYHF